ncbi:4-(cytidine 5'-diphospho)-2-C-methyl-D-erythritol kinase [Roseiarcaceae bacterium H3SJ34-1]|uniref:4-(cytidine 5'-diphospho)-2-C-methyl-D-erythritol kinase n=1 Tax=Terripilifer ovatus TaxID=3032367 RepID=UPI003AB996C3|nr:4-(cytidine 5'-diphospho)-2-C-methyl-D-erythritol kinase [Roseiarcaceae bacterium H3SJ34-1]
MLVEKAAAKVNLTLHVRGRRADGWHDLESLVAFSGGGDQLSLEPGATTTLTVSGPTAGEAGPDDANLVLRAARELGRRLPGLRGGAFQLLKRLPVAAGLGGGSSDAAAALRLLARVNGLSLDDARLIEAAAATGSDVPVCLRQTARMMRGRGDDLGPPLDLPRLFCVLVNPGVAVETRAVFAEMRLQPGQSTGFGQHPGLTADASVDGFVAGLKKARNDMEDAACVLAPVIGDVLSVIAAAKGCRLVRMSGSGATCFGLFETCHPAARAAAVIRRHHPGWWVKSTLLR